MHENSLCNTLRKFSISNIFKLKSFENRWSVGWKDNVRNLLGSNPTPTEVVDLGDHLSGIFQSTGSGRSQTEVAKGGITWECLICWYLNLCTVNSRTIAIKTKKSIVPKPVLESIKVSYGSKQTNTESDIICITFPDKDEYTRESSISSPKSLLTKLNHLVEQDFRELEIGIIQCKTNWNDNAQIPMLWDMVYSSDGFRKNNLYVGSPLYKIDLLENFTYSFVTVPTVKTEFKPNGTPVKRVTNLSGGNYWGKPSQESVADSIKEIFNKNFPNGSVSLLEELRESIPHLNGKFDYFNIYN